MSKIRIEILITLVAILLGIVVVTIGSDLSALEHASRGLNYKILKPNIPYSDKEYSRFANCEFEFNFRYFICDFLPQITRSTQMAGRVNSNVGWKVIACV